MLGDIWIAQFSVELHWQNTKLLVGNLCIGEVVRSANSWEILPWFVRFDSLEYPWEYFPTQEDAMDYLEQFGVKIGNSISASRTSL